MTCKDCIYEPHCILRISYGMGDDGDKELNNMEKCCKSFKNKSDYAEVKHGEWLEGKTLEKCSLCGKKGFSDWHYCPKCGAKMDGNNLSTIPTGSEGRE